EGARGALDPVELLLGGLAGELALAPDGPQPALEGDPQVVELDPGQLDGHQVGVFAFGDVQRRRPGPGAGPGRALPLTVQAKGVGEQPVHLVLGPLLLGAAQVLERVPLGSEHHLVLPRPWAAAAAAGSGTTQSGCVQRVHLPSTPTLVRRPSRMSSPPDATWPPRCPISSVLPTVGEGGPRDPRGQGGA